MVRLPDESLTRNAGWKKYLELFADERRAVPFDTTDYTAICQFRAAEDQDSDLVAQPLISVGAYDQDGIFAEQAGGNVLLLRLSLEDVAAIDVDEFFSDVLLGPTGGDPDTICSFRGVIGKGVSKWPA